MKKIVLAYSGGLDTSVMLHWLKQKHQCEIIAYCADVGQDTELAGLEEKALKTGASKIFIVDLKDKFVEDYIFSAIQAQAVYEGCYLLGTSLARPIIAKKQIEIALEEGADAVAHGATGKGNDQIRFELAYQALAPQITPIAPWREWPFQGRNDLIAYAKEHHIPVSATASKPYSTDRNLMHISFEGGVLEDPWTAPPKDLFVLTQNLDQTPNSPEIIEIEYVSGIPVAINNLKLAPAELLAKLNQLGGRHGIGRIDIVENRYTGMKSRGVYETPGVTILHTAHRAMESITVDRESMHLRDSLSSKFAELIYNGYWFAPEFQMLLNFLKPMQQKVTGMVRVELFKGNALITGRKSPYSLYSEKLVSFEGNVGLTPSDATGFIKLNALRFAGVKHD
ncbi:MAG: argininosuccinate synthase [Myxococcaceae bacterium]